MAGKKMDVGLDLVITPEAMKQQVDQQKAMWAVAQKLILGKIDSTANFAGVTPDLRSKLNGLRQRVESAGKT
jgi:hypothetical protein